MKKFIAVVLIAVSLLTLSGCTLPPRKISTVEGNVNTYHEMSDGTWEALEHSYKYKLEIKGLAPNTTYYTTYIYLSNIEEITFENAWKASTFSSAEFDVKDAVLVETITESESSE